MRDAALDRLLDAAAALVEAISFDENGIALPHGFAGGNGGLISRETHIKADEVRRAIEAVKRQETFDAEVRCD